MKEFQAEINGKKINFVVELEDAKHIRIKINRRESKFEINQVSPHDFSVLLSNKVYVIHLHRFANRVQAVIEGENLRFALKDAKSLRREVLSSSLISKEGRVSAPMPGKVVQVNVQVGQKVSRGEGMVVVEAMKMQNVFNSSIDGTIKAVYVKQGDAVENGTALVDVG